VTIYLNKLLLSRKLIKKNYLDARVTKYGMKLHTYKKQ